MSGFSPLACTDRFRRLLPVLALFGALGSTPLGAQTSATPAASAEAPSHAPAAAPAGATPVAAPHPAATASAPAAAPAPAPASPAAASATKPQPEAATPVASPAAKTSPAPATATPGKPQTESSLPPPATKVAPAPAAASSAPAANASAIGEIYGPVKPAETLWSIANRMRPDKSVVTEQVLVALYRANPRAFEGTINKLSKGAVLRVPSASEITALNPEQARLELRRLWNGGEATAEPSRPVIDPLQIAPPPPAAQAVKAGSVDTEGQGDTSPTSAENPAPAEAPASEAAPAAESEAPVSEAPAAVTPEAPAETAAAAQEGEAAAAWLVNLGQQASAILARVQEELASRAWSLQQPQDLIWPSVLVLAVLALLLQIRRMRKRSLVVPATASEQHSERTAPRFYVPQPPESEPAPAQATAVPVAARAEPAMTAPAPVVAAAAPPVTAPVRVPEPEPEPEPEAPAPAASLAAEPISTDEIGTKLDLARAYVEMGEKLLARVLLREVLQQGDAAQKADAEALLARLS